MSEVIVRLASLQDWLTLFVHTLSLSLLMVGGALTVAPELHRYMVEQQHWLSDAQFAASVAIGQSGPGPNVLYIGLLGLQVGMSSGGGFAGLAGMLLTVVAILLPCSVLTYFASRWGHANAHLRGVRAFRQGMAPIVIGLLAASGLVTAVANNGSAHAWSTWLLTLAAALLMLLTRLHLLVLIGTGALLGWFGFV